MVEFQSRGRELLGSAVPSVNGGGLRQGNKCPSFSGLLSGQAVGKGS
jgi:hypothetical protein